MMKAMGTPNCSPFSIPLARRLEVLADDSLPCYEDLEPGRSILISGVYNLDDILDVGGGVVVVPAMTIGMMVALPSWETIEGSLL